MARTLGPGLGWLDTKMHVVFNFFNFSELCTLCDYNIGLYMRTGLGAPARLDEGTMCSRARLGHCLYSLGYHGTTLHFLAFSTRAHLAQSTMGSGRVDPAQFQHYPRGPGEGGDRVIS